MELQQRERHRTEDIEHEGARGVDEYAHGRDKRRKMAHDFSRAVRLYVARTTWMKDEANRVSACLGCSDAVLDSRDPADFDRYRHVDDAAPISPVQGPGGVSGVLGRFHLGS